MIQFVAAALFICCLAGQLSAQQPQEQGSTQNHSAVPVKSDYPLDAITDFSAVMFGTFMFDEERGFHIYRSGNLFRIEGEQGVGYYLTDLAKQETYHVWDNGCSTDNHVNVRAVPWAAAARSGYKVERTVSGNETIEGHSCKIEDVTITSPELQRPLKLKFWEAEDLQGFPVKIESVRMDGHNKVIRYKNVVVGPQDPTLFMHPKICGDPAESPKPKKAASSSKAKAPAKDASPH
jgi:hypothetical protein